VSDLGSDTATLAIAAGEDVTVNSVDVVAEAADGTTADRTPPAQAIPDSADDEFDIPFNGTTVAGQDTTFTVITEIEDAAGNTETLSLNSSITGYEVTEGEAVVDPDGTDAEFALSTTAAVNNASRNATIAQTPTSTAGTAVDADQVASTFIDVTDIGLSRPNSRARLFVSRPRQSISTVSTRRISFTSTRLMGPKSITCLSRDSTMAN